MTAVQGTALRLAQEALVHAERECRYHDKDFDKLGTEFGREPRCESCKQPYRVNRALDAIDAAARAGLDNTRVLAVELLQSEVDRERGKVGDLVREVARKEELRVELAAEVDRLTEALKTGAYWLALDGTIRTDEPGPDVHLVDRDDDVWALIDGMWTFGPPGATTFVTWQRLAKSYGPLCEVAP